MNSDSELLLYGIAGSPEIATSLRKREKSGSLQPLLVILRKEAALLIVRLSAAASTSLFVEIFVRALP